MATQQDPITRKVQLTGGSTFTVSLPKDWAARQDIEPGSTVQLFSKQDQLIITDAQDGTDRRRVVINGRDRSKEDLARSITAGYVAGAEEIRIDGSRESRKRQVIRETITGLVGIEIHEETSDAVIARTMLDINDLSAEQTLVQMELTALSMHEDAVTAVLNGEETVARRVIRQDDDVDRLFRLICREFQRSLVDVSLSQHENHLTMFDYYTAARQVERIADHAEKIADVADRGIEPPPTAVADKLAAVSERSRNVVQDALSGLLEQNESEVLGTSVTRANDVVEDAKELDRTLYTDGVTDSYLLGTVVDSIIRTAEYGANIAEAGLQASKRTMD